MNNMIKNVEENIKNKNNKKNERNIGTKPIHEIIKAVKNKIAVEIRYIHYIFLLLKILQTKKKIEIAAIMNNKDSDTEN